MEPPWRRAVSTSIRAKLKREKRGSSIRVKAV
jgi:hypothetical protein